MWKFKGALNFCLPPALCSLHFSFTGCKCYDTASAFGGPLCNNTAVTADGLLCRTEATYKRCPKKCNRCTDFQPSSCVSITPTITSMSSQNTASSTQSQQAISTENQQPFISMQPSADSSPVSTIQSPPSTSASQSARQGPSSSTQPSPSTSAVKTIAVIWQGCEPSIKLSWIIY